jgi:hypothetical protein
MSDTPLDEKLFKIVRKWVDQDAVTVKIVEQIKAAFKDEGWSKPDE